MNQPLEPGLYIVATPIGNLGDVTERAAAVLRGAGLIACEDSRVTGKLLQHLGVRRPMRRYDDHSTEQARAQLIAAMRDTAVALVSDAGTPLISDPGYKLVRAARAAGIRVTALPGPSAAIAALTLSGLPSDRFYFHGFLPARDTARRREITGLAAIPATLILYESAKRLGASLAALADGLGDRPAAVVREISKAFEEVREGTLAALAAAYADAPPKGEIVVVIGPPEDTAPESDDAAIDTALAEALATMPPGKAAAEVAKRLGLDRKVLYARIMALREGDGEGVGEGAREGAGEGEADADG